MLVRHPCWVFHSTPTSASWLDAVEELLAKPTQLWRDAFGSHVELQAVIKRFLAETNAEPEPFIWTAESEHPLEKILHGNRAIPGTAGPPRRV